MKYTLSDRVALQMVRKRLPRKLREEFRLGYTHARFRGWLRRDPASAVTSTLRGMGLRALASEINEAIRQANRQQPREGWI